LQPDVAHLTDLMFEVIEDDAWRRPAAIAVHGMASSYAWDTVTQLLIDALFGNARTDGSVGA